MCTVVNESPEYQVSPRSVSALCSCSMSPFSAPALAGELYRRGQQKLSVYKIVYNYTQNVAVETRSKQHQHNNTGHGLASKPSQPKA